ncbi:hypothetical protein [Hahella ganghwensis]|uniref:hypothetical protein n=1 Tax=Hahella ganghwensis TaxID=286420 RepID=UPI0003683CBF|nr:hypothetical protein [Hahella ganghwensis]
MKQYYGLLLILVFVGGFSYAEEESVRFTYSTALTGDEIPVDDMDAEDFHLLLKSYDLMAGEPCMEEKAKHHLESDDVKKVAALYRKALLECQCDPVVWEGLKMMSAVIGRHPNWDGQRLILQKPDNEEIVLDNNLYQEMQGALNSMCPRE